MCTSRTCLAQFSVAGDRVYLRIPTQSKGHTIVICAHPGSQILASLRLIIGSTPLWESHEPKFTAVFAPHLLVCTGVCGWKPCSGTNAELGIIGIVTDLLSAQDQLGAIPGAHF